MRAILKRDYILICNCGIVPIRTNVKVIHYDKRLNVVVMELPQKYHGLGHNCSLWFPELKLEKENYFYMHADDVLIIDNESRVTL